MVEAGRKVKVSYRGFLDDGTVFDSTEQHDGEPIEFFVGRNQVIDGFDSAVSEMEVGEKRTIHIPAAQAYGEYDPNQIEVVPCDEFPNWEQLPVGEYIILQTMMGPMKILVQKVEDGNVYLDTNHEMAGKDLNFDLELVEICEGPDSFMEEYASCGCGDSCCGDTPAGCGSGCGGGSCC